jgi:excisionase family DNA binding protein
MQYCAVLYFTFLSRFFHGAHTSPLFPKKVICLMKLDMNQTEEKETDELELLTLTELSKTLKLNKATIRKRLMETKLLPYVKISRKLIRFMRKDVEEFLLSKKIIPLQVIRNIREQAK